MTSNLRHTADNREFRYFNEEIESLWKGPFIFIQGADTQLGMIESYLEKKPNPKWEKEIILTTKAITAINNMNPRPRFFIVCGDLIDAMPVTKKEDSIRENPLRPAQTEDFYKVFQKLNPDIPLVCVCGNHDIGNTPTPASIQQYVTKFGDDYFTFFCGGAMFIVINSQFFEDSSLVKELAEAQEIWLDEQLYKAKNGNYKHVLIFQHIPWFLKDPNEEKQYFNIANDIREKMLAKFHNAGVRTIFCGHYHRNAGGFYKDVELVVTSAIGAQLGNDVSGFRIVKVKDDSVEHHYYPLDDVPVNVEL